jgi:hypothetical protein
VTKIVLFAMAVGLVVAIAVHGETAATRPADFVARLTEGTTVELFGVNENPDNGSPGWRVDGEPLKSAPFNGVKNQMRSSGGNRGVEIGLRFTGMDRQRQPWNALNMQWSGGDVSLGLAGRTKDGKPVRNEFVLLGVVLNDLDRTNVTIRLAPTAAQVIARVRGNAAGSKASGDVASVGHFEVSNPREVDESATVTANIPVLPDGWQVVVRAVPRGRSFIAAVPPVSAIGSTGGQDKDITYHAKLVDIAEFRVEARNYSTSVEFRNVALKAGEHTDFQIVTHELPPEPSSAKPGEQGL